MPKKYRVDDTEEKKPWEKRPHVVVVPPTPPPPSIPFPRYARVKHYPEFNKGKSIIEISYSAGMAKKLKGIPEVFQYVQRPNQKSVAMTREIQNWMFSLFLEKRGSHPMEDTIKGWTSTYSGGRAFNNKAGFPACYNAITGQGSGLPMLAPVLSCGATLKIIGEVNKAHGIKLAEFEVINVNDPETLRHITLDNPMELREETWTLKDIPHLIYFACNWINSPLPHGHGAAFPGLGGRDVPIPLLSTVSTGLVDITRIKYLSAGDQIPAYPYYPLR